MRQRRMEALAVWERPHIWSVRVLFLHFCSCLSSSGQTVDPIPDDSLFLRAAR